MVDWKPDQDDIGRYTGDVFYPERHGRLKWSGGPSFAQESLVDAKGRCIFWAWRCESRTREVRFRSGWSGVMSLSKVLSLAAVGTLQIEPVDEHESYNLAYSRAKIPYRISQQCTRRRWRSLGLRPPRYAGSCIGTL